MQNQPDQTTLSMRNNSYGLIMSESSDTTAMDNCLSDGVASNCRMHLGYRKSTLLQASVAFDRLSRQHQALRFGVHSLQPGSLVPGPFHGSLALHSESEPILFPPLVWRGAYTRTVPPSTTTVCPVANLSCIKNR